jgi:photosystem II stability/assembly factor-like uncharacterized protein
MNKKMIAQVAAFTCLTIMLLVFSFAIEKDTSINSVSAQGLTQDVPTVISVEPSTAPNDLDTLINITGTGFTIDITNTEGITQPVAWLGDVQLLDATWVTTTMLNATVPFGMNTGRYNLIVTNPDGGAGSLSNAFNVTLGIGKWNGGDLFGGRVTQVLMKPGDPNTLYAVAYLVGLFRSRDAGEHWKFINDFVQPNFSIDPLHPSWLYVSVPGDGGFYRSQDEGDTWTLILNTWPDGRDMRLNHGEVYPSPHDPQVLFFSSAIDPEFPPPSALGLIKSIDGGTTWNTVEDMEGISVQDVSFHPTDPLQMVLGTQAGQVFQSTDGGDTWSEVNKPPLSNIGWIVYNPFIPSEVWISLAGTRGLFKSSDASFTKWIDITPVNVNLFYNQGSFWFINFTSPDSVYTVSHHSIDGGKTWQQFGTFTSNGEIRIDPVNSQIGYIGDDSFGMQKTIDGGETWEIKSQGLTGMIAEQIDVSRVDPLRVYAPFGDSPGAYRTDDGANSWKFLPLDSFNHVKVIREDPFNPQVVYLTGGSGFYTSTNMGLGWTDLGWNIPEPWKGGPNDMQPDPYQRGHLLVGFDTGSDGFHLHPTGQLYSSNDYGESWQPITVTQDLDLAWVTSIVFHPDTPGLVYLTSGGTGVYRSTDHGNTWERIDDLQQPDMAGATDITIATHPQPMLLVGTVEHPYRSMDDGATWVCAGFPTRGTKDYLFLDKDSTRLYFATLGGLFLSRDVGDSWERAAGDLGKLKVWALDYAVDIKNNTTILYASTAGGVPGDQGSTRSLIYPSTQSSDGSQEKPSYIHSDLSKYIFLPLIRRQLEAPSNLVDAGIYRFVSH